MSEPTPPVDEHDDDIERLAAHAPDADHDLHDADHHDLPEAEHVPDAPPRIPGISTIDLDLRVKRRRRMALDQRLRALYERRRADHGTALTKHTQPAGTDDNGRPWFVVRDWGEEAMLGGPSNEQARFSEADESDAVGEALLAAEAGLGESEGVYDYRIDGALGDAVVSALDGWAEAVCDEAEALTEAQRQAFLDFCHFSPDWGPELLCAVNVRCQQALELLMRLTGLEVGQRGAFDRRAALVAGHLSDEEFNDLLAAEVGRESSGAREAVEEALEALKWMGILDESGHARATPLPDQLHLRRGEEPYTGAVHAAWTGWQPDDGYDDDPWFAAGHHGGNLMLARIGQPHPRQVADDELDPLDPPRISEYTGETTQAVPITKDAEGLLWGLQAIGYALRWDERSERAQWTDRDPRGAVWDDLDDLAEATIWDCIAQKCVFHGRKMPPARFIGLARSDARGRALKMFTCDAFEHDYLRWLPMWDGISRIDGLLGTVFGLDYSSADAADVDAVAAWAARSILLGAVRRVREPGYKLDEVAVLVGPQRCGKSVFCSHLLPGYGRKRWFSDNLVFGQSGQHKEQVEALLGRVIVESSEMTGLRRADIEGLKAFLSRTDDRVRLAYGRSPSNIPRRCVVIGTSNEDALLPNDPTGNRRFLPVRIAAPGPCRPEDFFDEETTSGTVRDQLWAEAVARVDRGETPQHDYADAAAQTRLVALFRRDDEMIEELVSAYLGPREGNAVPQIDVQRHVAGALAAGDAGRAPIHANAVENRVLAAMRNCGWMATRRTINKRRVRAWEKPGVEPTSAVKRTPAASSGPADGREPF